MVDPGTKYAIFSCSKTSQLLLRSSCHEGVVLADDFKNKCLLLNLINIKILLINRHHSLAKAIKMF